MSDQERRERIRAAGDGWVQFAKERALRAHGVRMSDPGIETHAACPNCGSADRWTRVEVRGDSPGRTVETCSGCEHDLHMNGRCLTGDCQCVGGFSKLVAVPPRRGLVVMRCYSCGYEHRYGDEPVTAEEQAQRTAQLYQQAKIGKVPL
jgi:RNase P subunit RPR2